MADGEGNLSRVPINATIETDGGKRERSQKKTKMGGEGEEI